jgi:hypothetical protein
VTGAEGDAYHQYNQHPGLNKVPKQGNYLCYMNNIDMEQGYGMY